MAWETRITRTETRLSATLSTTMQHRLVWDRTRVCVVTGWRLMDWAMAGPVSSLGCALPLLSEIACCIDYAVDKEAALAAAYWGLLILGTLSEKGHHRPFGGTLCLNKIVVNLSGLVLSTHTVKFNSKVPCFWLTEWTVYILKVILQ